MLRISAEFRADKFKWTWPRAVEVVKFARRARKMDELQKALEDWFGTHGSPPTTDDIQKHVAQNKISILKRIGLDENGHRINVKKFKVFYRITGVSYEEVEADNAKEAREKFLEEFDEGDPLHCIDRDDIETVVPIAYEEKEGDTKDYGPSEESRQELDNALSGARIFALVRTDKDEDGESGTPRVSLFSSQEEAKHEMYEDFMRTWDVYERVGNVSKFYSPNDGIVRCYVIGQDKTASRWNVVPANKAWKGSHDVSA